MLHESSRQVAYQAWPLKSWIYVYGDEYGGFPHVS